ncbi:Metal-dependent hydrolases of the beta-lactamase superfamily II [hydrothermal vent metagenome]|uniref:Metal-dependent hydrolases of the beta-lactamase superfamily II n=1 Tax=hydrothermal vent metagenome TaxID=652676 RepID=A0A1W1D5A4_9ZZZZ
MIQILFDNYEVCNQCQSLWGFSAYLKEYKLLFDTGSNGRVLLKNMQHLKIDVKEIKYIFITHAHWDHIGGIDSIIELNPNVTLFVPSSLSKHLINDLKTLVKEVVICTKKPQKLFANLYTTGVLGDDIPEQSLIIQNNDKNSVLTGCGHFGIENITKVAQAVIQQNITCVMGGFHLLKSDETTILQTIHTLKQMGVQCAKPTHCSGDKAIQLFSQKFSS